MTVSGASMAIGHVSSGRGTRSRGALGRAVLVAMVVAGSGCGKGTPAPQAPSRGQAAPPPAARVASASPEETQAPIVYQSKGRRDPFSPPRADPAREEPVLNLKVTGIMWGRGAYYALVESESSPGMGTFIREHDVMESAKVLKITKQSVIFEVKTRSADGKPSTRYVAKHIRSGDK